MVLRKSFYIRWSAGRSPRVHEVNPGRDPSSRGRGRRGRPRGIGQAQLVFDQQTFAEAVGITTNAMARASIAGRQEDPSNLQRFRTHHPPTFTGGGDQMVTNHWFMQIEKVLKAMEITSDTTRIRLAAY